MRFLACLSIYLAGTGLLALRFLAATPASSCDRSGTRFDAIYSERKVYLQADAELNGIYAKLRPHLSSVDRLVLWDGQRAWLRRLDSQYSLNNDSAVRVNIGCARNQTIQWTNGLNERLCECVSSGCQSGRLGCPHLKQMIAEGYFATLSQI